MALHDIPRDRIVAVDEVYQKATSLDAATIARIDDIYEHQADAVFDAIDQAGERARAAGEKAARYSVGVEQCIDDLNERLPIGSDALHGVLNKDLITAEDYRTLTALFVEHVGPVPA